MIIDELYKYGIPLQIINELKSRGIHKLYDYQRKAIEEGILNLKDSYVISAPTASGKTLLAELLSIKFLIENPDKKVLYITPLKSLAKEKYETFKIYEKYGIKVAISTGDYDSSDEWLENYNIIITTIEKADSLLRHNAKWLKDVKLVIIDEIHIINDKDRGPTLEMLIVKLKKIYKPLFLALSATIPNDFEISNWLGSKLIKDTYRPVPLKEGVFFNYKIYFKDCIKSVRKFYGEEICDIVIDTILSGGQCLIFVNSRNQAENVALKISETLKKFLKLDEKRKLIEISNEILNLLEEPTDTCKKLSACIKGGVAFHHAGLLPKHRELIEKYFRERILKVIVATPTLAAGVNLPARRVIVKDYTRYEKGRIVYLPIFEVKQMFGRCLPEDVYVKTNLGEISIKDVIENINRVKILSYNFLKNSFEFVIPIGYTYRRVNSLIEISTEDSRIILTEDHPILCYDGNLRWKPAGRLSEGDIIVKYDDGLCFDIVKNIRRIFKEEYVYDIILLRNHNFTANDILVHNSGRPGFDEYGEAFLIAKTKKSKEELFKRYILSDPERVTSKLSIEKNLRFHILGLVSSGIANDKESLINILKETFYYFQTRRIDFEDKIEKILNFFIKNNLVIFRNKFYVTDFGKRVVELYIDPETAVLFKKSLSMKKKNREIFYLYTISKVYEMPKIPVKVSEIESIEEFAEKFGDDLYVENESYEEFLENVKITSMLYDWINETKENIILNKYNIAPGDFVSRIEIAEWLCYCLKEIARVVKSQEEQFLSILLERIKYGVKEELINLVRVEGIGRVRARLLYKFGIKSVNDIINVGMERLKKILGEKLGEKIYKNSLKIYKTIDKK